MAHPSVCRDTSERDASQAWRPGILELALRAISLRTSSARSVVTGSQRLGRTSLTFIFGGIRDVAALRLAWPLKSLKEWSCEG